MRFSKTISMGFAELGIVAAMQTINPGRTFLLDLSNELQPNRLEKGVLVNQIKYGMFAVAWEVCTLSHLHGS